MTCKRCKKEVGETIKVENDFNLCEECYFELEGRK